MNQIKLSFIILLFMLASVICVSCISPGYTEVSVPDDISAMESGNSNEVSGVISLGNNRYSKILLDAFKGKTEAELTEAFDREAENYFNWGLLVNMPTRVFFKSSGNIYVYNKQTGNITFACPDPLCDHTDCMFNKLLFFLAPGETKLFGICHQTEGKMFGVYTCDMDGTNAKKIYETDDWYFHIEARGDKIYTVESFLNEDGSVTNFLISIDAEGNYTRLTPPDISVRGFFLGETDIYIGDSVKPGIYRLDGDKLVQIYEGLTFGTKLKNGYFTFSDKSLNEETDYMLRLPESGGTAEKIPFFSGTLVNGYYYTRAYVDGTTYRLTRTDPESGETITVVDFITEDYPDKLSGAIYDGDFLYTYITDIYDVRQADEYTKKTGFRRSPSQHFAIIDITTGEKYILIPDD